MLNLGELLEQDLVGAGHRQALAAAAASLGRPRADGLLETAGGEGAGHDAAAHVDQASPLGLEAGHLLLQGGDLLFERPTFSERIEQVMAFAESGQFGLQFGGFGLEGGGLLVEEADAVGQALLALVEGGLQVGVAEGFQQLFVLCGISAGDDHFDHPFGARLFAASGGDVDARG